MSASTSTVDATSRNCRSPSAAVRASVERSGGSTMRSDPESTERRRRWLRDETATDDERWSSQSPQTGSSASPRLWTRDGRLVIVSTCVPRIDESGDAGKGDYQG